MKTLTSIAITAFAFLALANFASAQGAFKVSSTAFMDDGILPISAIYNRTRDAADGTLVNECAPDGAIGENRSPPLSWTNVPPGTITFAVIGFDREAEGYAWGMYNIPGTEVCSGGVCSLPENAGAADSRIGKQTVNMYNRLGYGGPCPAATNNPGPHLVVFTVYALRQRLGASNAIALFPIGLNPSAKKLADTLMHLGSCSNMMPCDIIAGWWPSIPPNP